VKGSYNLSKNQAIKLQNDKKKEIDLALHKYADKFNDEKRILENERQKQLDQVTTREEITEVQKNFESKLNQKSFGIPKQVNSVQTDVIERVEKHEDEVKKNNIEEDSCPFARFLSHDSKFNYGVW